MEQHYGLMATPTIEVRTGTAGPLGHANAETNTTGYYTGTLVEINIVDSITSNSGATKIDFEINRKNRRTSMGWNENNI